MEASTPPSPIHRNMSFSVPLTLLPLLTVLPASSLLVSVAESVTFSVLLLLLSEDIEAGPPLPPDSPSVVFLRNPPGRSGLPGFLAFELPLLSSATRVLRLDESGEVVNNGVDVNDGPAIEWRFTSDACPLEIGRSGLRRPV